MDIAERRAALRTALKSTDQSDFSSFAAAVEGADEDERALLAKTLPPSRLYRTEGPTPRACFVLAALGRPAEVAKTHEEIQLDLTWLESPRAVKNHPQPSLITTDPHHLFDLDTEATAAGVLERGEQWCYQFIDVWLTQFFRDSWEMVNRLIISRRLVPESVTYLGTFIAQTFFDRWWEPARGGRQIADFLRSDERYLDHDFWALFRVDDCGGQYLWKDSTHWGEALLILCDEIPGFRSRLLDESLQALLRGFADKNMFWYQKIQRLLDPTPDEVETRAKLYLSLLDMTLHTSVSLAQDMLKRAIGQIDPIPVLNASPPVLQRSEKKLVKNQLGLLKAIVKTRPELADQVSQVVGDVLDGLPTELAVDARRLIVAGGNQVENRPAAENQNKILVGTTPRDLVVVPPPRQHSLPPVDLEVRPIADEQEFWGLVADCLEGVGNGTDLPRILAYLLDHHPSAAATQMMLERAWKVVRYGYGWSSPRGQLFALLQKRASITSDRVYAPVLDTMPTALLARQFVLLQNNVTAISEREALVATPLPVIPRRWVRTVMTTSEEKSHFLEKTYERKQGPYWLTPAESSAPDVTETNRDTTSIVFWLTPDEPPLPESPSWDDQALDVSMVPYEFNWWMYDAGCVNSYDQVVQWAAWLYTNNPDLLAAKFHPLLWLATQVTWARGVPPLLTGLGESRQLPSGPTYSALALGLSAKQADHRMVAAEAVASLADRGLLVPEPFATEITAHLSDGFILAGRLAGALADAASISPIAGYRVLQTLVGLLPHLDGINQAARLVELTAKLAADYGTPVEIPESLATKTKGSSLLAVSLRSLSEIRPEPTSLIQAAAEQATFSLL